MTEIACALSHIIPDQKCGDLRDPFRRQAKAFARSFFLCHPRFPFTSILVHGH
ncbi:hypothetical protein DEV92_1238 [Phyllobacterium myrsinacearum]|nr:hypothetical protein DEV92_1238 [Phyllobacterium myrsinacearum]RZU96801.1 hypothetical protein EV654_5235 [Phyllobacterium myrsinacearum]